MARTKIPPKPQPGIMAKKVPQVMQMEALECGAAALDMVCAYWGKWIPLEQVRADCGVSRDGSSALNIVKAARSYGLDARGYRYEPETLREQGLFPCIAHVGFDHFVVVRGFKGDTVYINDPAAGERKTSMEQFDRDFTGIVLQFEPTDAFEPGGRPASIKDFALERLHGAKAAFIFVAVTSAITALLGLVSPVMSQVFMDRLLTGANSSWTWPFLILLGAFFLVQIVLSALNAVYLMRVEGKIAASSNAAFLWKVLHLPMEFFSQRLVGDIAQRMGTNGQIAQRLANQLAPLLIQAVMLVVYLVVMVSYSIPLAIVGIASVAIDIAVARIVSSKRVNATRVMMRDSANLSSTTLTGISMIETLKAQGAETGFFKRWSGFQASVNTGSVQITRMNQKWSLVSSFAKTLSDTAVLAIGVWCIIQGQLTTGALLSMQSIIQKFASPAQSLISVMQMLQEMRTDMERVQDVMDYPVDPMADPASPVNRAPDADRKLHGDIEFDHVTFGYSKLGDPVVKDLSFSVRQGGCIALVGASGCGKSTVSKLLAGLYTPWSGEVRVDGTPLDQIPRSVRGASIALIDQDVVLFKDTIGENIRLWDKTIQDFEVILAARDAQVHDDIVQRPGAYDAMLAENGSDLSGGQRQRIEIARALAQDPTVLIMDEATSALDAQTEGKVMEAVRARGITLIVVAHRLSTVRDADEILVFDQGEVVQRGTHDELYAVEGAYRRLISME